MWIRNSMGASLPFFFPPPYNNHYVQFMCRNFLKQIPSLLDYPHSRQISTSCRHWFKSRRRGRGVLIRIRRYAGVRINSLARYIYIYDPVPILVIFFFFATGERDAGEDPVSGANVFRTINISILVFLPVVIVGTTPSCSLKGRSVKSLLYFPLLLSREDSMLGWPLLRLPDVDPGGLECEKVDYVRWLLHFHLQACTRPLRTLLRITALWFALTRIK